jgi:hypothetical protein
MVTTNTAANVATGLRLVRDAQPTHSPPSSGRTTRPQFLQRSARLASAVSSDSVRSFLLRRLAIAARKKTKPVTPRIAKPAVRLNGVVSSPKRPAKTTGVAAMNASRMLRFLTLRDLPFVVALASSRRTSSTRIGPTFSTTPSPSHPPFGLPNTGDKLRSGARVRPGRRGHEAAPPAERRLRREGWCRRKLRQLHPLVGRLPRAPMSASNCAASFGG